MTILPPSDAAADPHTLKALEPQPDPKKMPIMNSSVNMLAVIAGITALFFASTILLQLVLSLFLFFFISPLVDWAERKKISRKLSSIVIVISFVALTGATVWGSYGAIATLAEEVPQYMTKIKKTIKSVRGQAEEIQKNASGVIPQSTQKQDIQKVEVVDNKIGGGSGEAVLHGVGSVFELLAAAFLVPILVLFLLLEKPYLQSAIFKAVPRSFNTGFVSREMSQMVTGFFFGNIVVGVMTAVGFYALFSYLHLENALLLAVLAGFANLIPMVGAILGGLFPMIQAFLQFDTATPAIIIFASSVFLHFFVANFVIPKIVGSKINVNASSATIGLIFWGWLWGPLGLLLAVPLTATIRIILMARESTSRFGELIQESSGGNLTRTILTDSNASSSASKPVVSQ